MKLLHNDLDHPNQLLFTYCQSNQYSNVCKLLKSNPNVNLQYIDPITNCTSLTYVIIKGYTNIVELLLQHNAMVNYEIKVDLGALGNSLSANGNVTSPGSPGSTSKSTKQQQQQNSHKNSNNNNCHNSHNGKYLHH